MRRKNSGIGIGELKYQIRLKYYLEFHNKIIFKLLKVTKINNKRAKINVIVKYWRSGC